MSAILFRSPPQLSARLRDKIRHAAMFPTCKAQRTREALRAEERGARALRGVWA